ncbi:uncharacterized protein NECHADRAFT_83505 [Fusarium vanettenii 77-13-4]|uniref:Uncharacterized protein n=1 Tax=Fusarium vanettenii (strain ATCC MYA-4622 / CBS 123669 / FGSC 9596 / NRRL 45880 / 77-13-4) TaxID=660122 RepID=C7Z474_FUSV7|nr:uncharacterized protein NECHADRAFT_83505 [Fusarium vanettenii 77-13-4]EEU41431.1 predicted protein [Fusarium vanettenii 77-13-4]
MLEINKSLELTTTPSEVTVPIPRSSIDARRAEAERELRRAVEIGNQRRIKRNRTRTLRRSDYHAILQYVAPKETPTLEICQSHSECKVLEPYITSKYRVCLFATRPRYYHPECFEDRYDVTCMIPNHFKVEDPETCGLMAQKWFQHNRLVKLDVIAEYIMQDYLYQLGMLEDQPMPELKDYTTETRDRCSLKDLVDSMTRLLSLEVGVLPGNEHV